MGDIRQYNRLLYGETIGWVNGVRRVKTLTPLEYETLLSLLGHRRTRSRWSAADRLGKIGKARAVGPLIASLQDPSWLVRLHAAKALGYLGAICAVKPLICTLVDECGYVRRRSATALGGFENEHAIQALVFALSDPDTRVRRRAQAGLSRDPWLRWFSCQGKLHSVEISTDAPIKALAKLDIETRYLEIIRIGKMRIRIAIEFLENLHFDPIEYLQRRATNASSLTAALLSSRHA
jgi:HEAT repeat protein